jgi:FkbM family methyltransferase
MNAVSGGHLPESGEEVTLKLLSAAFPTEQVCILDVGANFGDFSALATEVLGLRSKVWAFEPLPANFEALNKRFSTTPQVTTLNSAVGNTSGYLPFFVDGPTSTIGSLVPRKLEHEGVIMAPQVTVPVVTLDAWVESQGITHVHLLKVDVEGADLDVLKGATELLNKGKISLIQFEFSAAQIDARHFFKDFFGLLNQKYSLYRIVGDGLIEIPNYVERYEIFSCTNYLAVLRDSFGTTTT